MAKTPLSSYDQALDEIASEGLSVFKPPVQETERRPSQSAGSVPQNLISLFDTASSKYQVPVNVLLGLAEQESGFNPTAVGQPTKWGRAKGLMQYLDTTASNMGINPYDPAQSIDAAAKQIRQRLDKGYSMEDAVKEHFAGPNRNMWGAKTAQYGVDVMRRAQKFLNGIPGGPDVAAQQPQEQANNPDPYPRAQSAMEDMDIQRMKAEAEERQQFKADLDDLNKDEPGRFTIPTDEQYRAYYEGLAKNDKQEPLVDVQGDAKKAEELRQSMQQPTGDAAQTAKPQAELKPWNPTLWERIQMLIPGDRDAAAVEVAARKIAKRDGISVDEVYRSVGGNRPMFNPEGRAPIQAVSEGVGVVAKQLPDVPAATANAVLRAVRGGDVPVEDKSMIDRGITATDIPPDPNADPNYDSLQGIGQSLGFTASNLVPSIAAGAAGNVVSPVAGTAAGFGTSATIAYRASKDQFLSDVRKMAADKKGSPLTEKEWDDIKVASEAAATRYGAWEAIPEALGSVVALRMISHPLAGGTRAARLADATRRLAKEQAMEQATETATTWGQNKEEQAVGLTNEDLSLGDAFRKQALQTAIVSGISGGAAQAGRAVYDRARGNTNAEQAAPVEASPEGDTAAAEPAATQPAAEAAPTAPAEAQPQPVPQSSGPLGRALENAISQQETVSTDGAAPQTTAPEAGEQWYGAPGTEQTVSAPGIEPFRATVEGYAPNGDVLLRDANGESLQVGRDEIAAPEAAPVEQAAAPVAEEPAPQVEQTTQPVEDANEVVDPKTGEITTRVVEEEAPARQKSYDEMDEPELRQRLKYLATQAKQSGWDTRLTAERRKVEAAIDAKTTNLRNEQSANSEVPAQSQPDNTTPVQRDESGDTAQQPDVAPAADQAGAGGSADVLSVPATADANAALNKDGSAKWFGRRQKAEEFIEKKGLADTHEIRQVDRRFEIHPKETASDPQGTKLLTESSPPPAEGHTRLYRGEHRNHDRGVYRTTDKDDGKVGGWFTTELDYAHGYRTTQEQGRPTADKAGRIVYVDVPTSQLSRYEVEGTPLADDEIRRGEGAYFIPSLRRDEVIEPDADVPAAPKEVKPVTGRVAGGPRVNRARKLLGAEVGETVVPQDDIGYAKGGTAYRIDKIDKNGTVHVTNTATGGGTTLSLADMERAHGRKVGFDRQQAEAVAAEESAHGQADSMQEIRDRANSASASQRVPVPTQVGEIYSPTKVISSKVQQGRNYELVGKGATGSLKLRDVQTGEEVNLLSGKVRASGNEWIVGGVSEGRAAETVYAKETPAARSEQKTGSAVSEADAYANERVMTQSEVNERGDSSLSPWLFADGRIVHSNGDHISLSDMYDFSGYRDMSLATGAIRATFHKSTSGHPEDVNFVSLQLFDDQKLTPAQYEAVASFVEANDARILVGVDRSGANTRNAEKEEVTSLSELKNEHTQPDSAGKTDNSAGYGANNKLVSQDRAAELRQRLKAKFSQLNSGIDPEILAIGTELAVFHIEASARKFADFARAMSADLDMPLSRLRPYLRSWYNGARDMMEDSGISVEGMDSPESVRAELAKLDQAPVTESAPAQPAPAAENQAPVKQKPSARTDSRQTGALDDMVANFDSEVSQNVPSTRSSVEQNSSNADDAVSVVQAADVDDGRGNASRPGRASESAQPERGAGQRDQRLSDDGSTAGGERGNQRVHQPDGQFGLEGGVTGSAERAGSGRDSSTGSDVDRGRAKSIAGDAPKAGASDLNQRLAAQRKADKAPTKWGDKASIDEALPLLLPAQREDVLKVEQQHAKMPGILITNGTGTGKTASGMGVAKRYANAGKDNILMVVPTDKIAADWVKFGGMMGMNIKQLDGVNDNGGKGPVITTYANMGQNDALAQREWDLIIPDEAHYLSSNEKGEKTGALEKLRALSGHHAGFHDWMKSRYAKEWSAIEEASELARKGDKEAKARMDRLQEEWNERAKPLRQQWQERWAKQEDLTKVVFLSATPFAYVKNVDYAEGYLFNYTPPAEQFNDRSAGGYNSGDAYQSFFMQHFGYRMRYNKLTQPEAGVNSELMEQNFNQWLKDTGALTGRTLDVPHDYDRKFALIDDAAGRKLDEALKYLNEAENGRYRPIYEEVMRTFDYQRRMFLLESMKARAAVPMIKQHLAMGRKVVVFHDYNKGGGFSPFSEALGSIKPEMREEARALFQHPRFRIDFRGLDSAINTMTTAFPDAMLFNGIVPKAQRRRNADLFNDDKSRKNLIVVQSDAGREGVSLHDTTGKHQRVLINLGMPVKPVAATQIEGRIYRTGQASDAVFRYLTTGTAWEASAFASKIAERASTAENLALGTDARGLKQSFIDAYTDADAMEASREDGKGGKAYDRSLSAGRNVSPFQKAKTFYYAQQKNTKRRDHREGVDYFATPEPVGMKMVEWADIKPGDKVLEPSAGHGAIARFFPDQTDVTMVEPSYDLSQRAALANGTAKIVNSNFEDFHVTNKFDAIVMNPPYGNGGKTAIEHVTKAGRHLREGGRIVALIPRGGMADRRLNQFLEGEESKGLHLVAKIDMPSSTFERAGTSVNTQVVVLEKHSKDEDAQGIQQRNIDLSKTENVNELFDRIENLVLPQRQELTADEAIANAVNNARYSVSDVRSSIVNGELGGAVENLLDAGQVVIHQEAPQGVPQGTQGWTDEQGIIHLVASQLNPANATSVLLHEAFHAGAQPLVGEARWKNLNERFERFLRAAESRSDLPPSNDWERAYARIMIAEGMGDQMTRERAREELAAYAVENFERMPAGIRKWAQSIIGAVKEFIARRFGKQLGEVTPAQLRSMAKAALRSGRTAGRESVATSVSDIPETLSKSDLGWFAKRLTEKGSLVFHETAPENAPNASGWFDGNTIHIVTSAHKTAEQFNSTLIHEAFHAGMQNISETKRWDNVIESLYEHMAEAEHKDAAGLDATTTWDKAYQKVVRAQRNGDAMQFGTENHLDHVAEELGAYAVEHYEAMPPSIKRWVSGLVGAIKDFLNRNFGIQVGQVTPAQLRSMAAATIRYRVLHDAISRTPSNGTEKYSTGDPTPPARKEVDSWIGQKWDATKELSDQALKTVMPTLLHWTPSRVILTRVGKDIPALKEYADTKLSMDTFRDEWHAKTDKLAQRWTKYRSRNVKENSELMALMHETTLAQVDPSEDFQASVNNIDLAALRTGDTKSEAFQAAQAKVEADKVRRRDYDELKERFDKLSPEAQDLYRGVRDIYSDLANTQEQIIIDNLQKAMEYRVKEAERNFEDEMQKIRDDGLKGQEATDAVEAAKKRLENARKRDAWNRKARITKLRQEFESNRVAGPYFPLSRFGDFFVTARDKATGEVVSFSRMESAREQTRVVKELKGKGYDVEEGVVSKSTELRKQVPPDFVARIEDILKDMPASKETQDQVWQLYLQTMPDYSLRKNRIHRKGRAGFEEDALRAFASHMFHGAHQTARLKYAMDLADLLDVARRQTKNTRSPVRSGLVVNQIEKNHQYVMNPTSNRISQIATQGAFMFFLAQSPAAALVNMAQTFIIGVPKLAAFNGGNTARGMAIGLAQTSKALADITRGGFFAEKSAGLNADEKKALDTAYRIGLITRTQSHDVAGIADSGIKYTAARAKIMAALSWMFHHGERVNREATFLAAYRIAKRKGYGSDLAIDKAAQVTWDTHYDYQNTSRPAIMHSNTGKALLVFRNYTLNMLSDLAYNTYSIINPRDAAERKEARTQMLGIGTMLAFNAGIRGLPLYGIAMMIAGMFSDDGEDPETELKKTLLEHMPPSLVGMMMDGVPGYAMGIDLSQRIGFGDLWFRSDDRDREGQEAYNYWLQQVLGASVAIPANWVRGVGQISDGYTWRGIETLVPKAIRDPMKAWRYYTEGATTKLGDPIVDNVSGWDIFKQAIGFTPAAISEQYKLNNVNMNKQKAILEQRTKLLSDYYKADMAGDEAKLDEIGKKMDEYSDKYPEMQIDNKTIRRSIKNRERYRDSNTGGMSYNNNLRDRLTEEQPAKIYR